MFFKTIHSRIKIILFFFIMLMILIVFKVFYIQVIDYERLNKYASGLWSRNLPIEANRGLIYDRNGIVLADNLTTTGVAIKLVVPPFKIINVLSRFAHIWVLGLFIFAIVYSTTP